jgi:hypothetical protein
MFFEGPNLYSYGHHFLLARRLVTPFSLVLVNRHRASVTTSRQTKALTYALRRACIPYVFADDPAQTAEVELAQRIERIRERDRVRASKPTEIFLGTNWFRRDRPRAVDDAKLFAATARLALPDLEPNDECLPLIGAVALSKYATRFPSRH